MRIIGVDPSSRKIAMAIYSDDEGWSTHVIESKTQERAYALAELQSEYEEFLLNLSEDETYAFVELPLVGRSVKASVMVAQTQAVCLASCVQCGSNNAYEVNVQAWKRVVVGRGNAGKPDVRAWLESHESDLAAMAGGDQDLVDAFCIAIYGRGIIERSERLQVGVADQS